LLSPSPAHDMDRMSAPDGSREHVAARRDRRTVPPSALKKQTWWWPGAAAHSRWQRGSGTTPPAHTRIGQVRCSGRAAGDVAQTQETQPPAPAPGAAAPGMQATRRRAGAAARHWPAVPSVHPPSRTLGSSQPHWSERPRRRRSPHGVYVATTRLTDGLSGSSECIDRTDSAAAEERFNNNPPAVSLSFRKQQHRAANGTWSGRGCVRDSNQNLN
jgi:hypothetical protein